MTQTKPKHEVAEETKQPMTSAETYRLTQYENERNRLQREIDILKIHYEKQQQLLADARAEHQAHLRTDLDKIARQLEENRAREIKLTRTQSEVNQLRAQMETDFAKQKDLLLRKEVELDAALADIKKQKQELAARLTAAK